MDPLQIGQSLTTGAVLIISFSANSSVHFWSYQKKTYLKSSICMAENRLPVLDIKSSSGPTRLSLRTYLIHSKTSGNIFDILKSPDSF